MKACLLVSAGAADGKAGGRGMEYLAAEAEETFKGWRVFSAVTGRQARETLEKRGLPADSLEDALERLKALGATEVLVQPTYLFDGREYEGMLKTLDAYRSVFPTVRSGAPLLASREDRRLVARLAAEEMPPLADGEAWVFMGHGGRGGERIYGEMTEMFRENGFDRGFVAVLNGEPSLDGVIGRVKAAGCRSVYLAPLMFAAGGHAVRDMAGPWPDSWKSRLEAAGLSVSCIMRGLGEDPGVRAVYLDHARHAGRLWAPSDRLRSGFTTGTCAAAAVRAACQKLLLGESADHVPVMTPAGIAADLAVEQWPPGESGGAACAVQKDAGDDPDVTDKAFVAAYVFSGRPKLEDAAKAYTYSYAYGSSTPAACAIYLYGGDGVGLATRAGLACPVGKSAINPVPREMIIRQAEECLRQAAAAARFGGSETAAAGMSAEGETAAVGMSGENGIAAAGMSGRSETAASGAGAFKNGKITLPAALSICVTVPGGEKLAARTFNRDLGILGGISILGSSGIVEPMSEAALTATIRLEARMKLTKRQRHLIMTPGNYGEAFIREHLRISLDRAVRISNFVGDGLEILNDEGAEAILFVGHIGKLIKVAGGVLNTHSRYGDRRMEILADCAREALRAGNGPSGGESGAAGGEHGAAGGEHGAVGGEHGAAGGKAFDAAELETGILKCNTTEEAVELLRSAGAEKEVFSLAVRRIQRVLGGLPFSRAPVEVVTFSSVYGILAMTDGAMALADRIRDEQREV